MKLFDNLYAYVWEGNDNNCNSYLFADCLPDDGHVLIDPGHVATPFYGEPGLAQLQKRIEKDGLSLESVRLIILTHAHSDHSEAADAIRKTTGARIALHKADAPLYEHQDLKADEYLEEGELALAGSKPVTLTVYQVPGHSPGSIALYWAKRKVLIAGDLVFYQSTGRVDTPGGSATALKRSIERMSQLGAEYVLCGHPYGHPGIIEGKDAVRQNFDLIKHYFF